MRTDILAPVGGFLMALGLAVIGIGWYGTAHTGYVFEQIPYLVSGGLLGLGLTFCGALVFFSSWLARLVQLQREQTELTRRLLAQSPTLALPTISRVDQGRHADETDSPIGVSSLIDEEGGVSRRRGAGSPPP